MPCIKLCEIIVKLFFFFFAVTLSTTMNSLTFLTIHRSAAANHVCADEWQENLSQLACNQMGLG